MRSVCQVDAAGGGVSETGQCVLSGMVDMMDCQVDMMEVPLGRLLLWWILVRFLPAMGKLQGEGGPWALQCSVFRRKLVVEL